MPEIKEVMDELLKLRNESKEKQTKLDEALEASNTKAGELSAEMKKMQEDNASKQKQMDEMMKTITNPNSGLPGMDDKDVKGKLIAKEAFDLYVRDRGEEMSAEHKALIMSDGNSGGALVPNEQSSRIIEMVTEISPVRQLAFIMQTSKAALEIPKETGLLSAAWAGEQTTRTEDTGTKFNKELVPVHTNTVLVKASRDMLSDSELNIEAYFDKKVGIRMGYSEGTAFISGNGVTRPEGLLSNSSVDGTQSTTAASEGFVPNDLIDLEASLISTYGVRAVYLMARATVGYIRKFQDDVGRGLNLVERDAFKQLEQGTRALLLNGYPLFEAPDVPGLGSAAKVAIYGDIAEAYTIVDRLGMIVIRDPFSSKTTGLVEYLFERRLGGQVVQPDAVKYLQTVA